MADEKMDIQKIIETKEILQLLCEALLTLNDDEFKLVKDLFFEDKTLNEISQSSKVSITIVARRRDKILSYIKKMLQ